MEMFLKYEKVGYRDTMECFSKAEKNLSEEDRKNLEIAKGMMQRKKIRNLGEQSIQEVLGKLGVFLALNKYPRR